MKWDLIIFDCDGVLVDSEAIGNKFIAEALTALGIETSTDLSLIHIWTLPTKRIV